MNSSRDWGSVKNENCAIKMETGDKIVDVKWHVSRKEQKTQESMLCYARGEHDFVRRNAGQRDEMVITAVSSGGMNIAVNKQAFRPLPGRLALAWFLL